MELTVDIADSIEVTDSIGFRLNPEPVQPSFMLVDDTQRKLVPDDLQRKLLADDLQRKLATS